MARRERLPGSGPVSHLAVSPTNVLAVGGTLFVGSFAPQEAWIVLAGIVAVGTLLYFVAAREAPAKEPA